MTNCRCTYPDDRDCPVHGDVATLALTATYTAAEVKVLTETASKVAYELGRKDAGEEIAQAIEARTLPGPERDMDARIARNIASLPSGAVSDERSGGGE